MAPAKHSASAAFKFRQSKSPTIVPGLGVDVPELQQARRLWQVNRFDQALELFEKGVQLSDSCRKQLEEAETKVELLTRRGGTVQAEPFKPRA